MSTDRALQANSSPSSSGAMVKLASYTVAGSAVTDITFSGLDLSAYDAFELDIKLKNATASTPDVSLYYNGDTTATNYYRQMHHVVDTVTTATRTNNGAIDTLGASVGCIADVKIIRDVDGYPRAFYRVARLAASGITYLRGAHIRNNTANVTSITLSSSVASALAIGSSVVLYGRTTNSSGSSGANVLSTAPIASGVLTINGALGDFFNVALNANVTSIVHSGLPASGFAQHIRLLLTQDATGSRTVAWPGSYVWEGGVAPSVQSAPNSRSLLQLITFDQGVAWMAKLALQGSLKLSHLHFNGADASTTFTDESGNVWVASGNVQIDTAQSVFSGASGLFDGNGDFLTLQSPSNHTVGSAEFTLAVRARLTANSTSAGEIYSAGDGIGNQEFRLFCDPASGKFKFQIYQAAAYQVQLVSTTSSTLATWFAIAVTRQGNTWRLFINGALEATQVLSLTIPTPVAVRIGRTYYNVGANPHYYDFNGHLDEFMFELGYARYTAAYTPEGSPYP